MEYSSGIFVRQSAGFQPAGKELQDDNKRNGKYGYGNKGFYKGEAPVRIPEHQNCIAAAVAH
jgi:hypothetical protein